MDNLSEKVAELSKRRGFFSPTAEAYGGVAGFQTFGPEGAELKRNIENSWRKKFTTELGHREIEAPTVMPEPVFEASGHLEGFDDMLVECPECGVSSRADHIVEDNTEIEEAEAFSKEKIESLFKEHDLQCPECGESLVGQEVNDFNLMFETNIGPGSSNPGYLRPETAQGIFTEFPRFKEYMRNQLPFGITQIGKAYRNEISPRQGLVRVREFTQAELEHFIDPEEDSPDIEKVKDVEMKLYPVSEQEKDDGEYLFMSVEEAIEEEVIESEWIAYYLGYAKQWYESIGIDMDRFRFRQHLPDELAHYSTDCWDAESDIGDSDEEDWLEISGYSYRGCYDLSKHNEYSEDDFTVFKEYDEPEVVEEKTVDPDMGYLGPEFGGKAGEIADALEDLAEEDPEAFEAEKVIVEVDGEDFSVPSDKCNFSVEEVKKSGEHILPHVAEPSFGIDRILYTVLVHAYTEDEVDGEDRTVMQFSEEVAPTKVAVFPLMDKEGLGEKAQEVADELRSEGFSVKYDDTGNIGRRYRRQDEVGTPVCVTVDYETLENDPETVTVRDRDSTEQERVEIEELAEHLR
jgi:glycyl-tRNA synthetase